MKKELEIKPEIMWAVWNAAVGFYTDTALTRRDMVEKHLSSLGETRWADRAKVGDVLVRVKISPQ